MKSKITLVFLLLLSSMASFAQSGGLGNLTIFSEDGDKFFLVLNGEKQSDIAQTNLRIEALNQPYYNAKIIFDDKSLTEISKNNLTVADFDGVYQDVTYKIKRDKNNKSKMKLNFFSTIPVEQHYLAPKNVYVIHYGQPVSNDGYTQTTTTTTTVGQGTNVGANINMGGIKMNVNVSDPYGQKVTETTTTHSSSSTNSTHHKSADCNRNYAMNTRDFNTALSTIKGQNFDETRLKVAKQIASANCLSAGQITQICETFGFEESKLDFAKYVYEFCTEPNNYFKVNPVFGFSSSVDDLTEYIQSRN